MRRLGGVDCLPWDLCDGEWNGSNAGPAQDERDCNVETSEREARPAHARRLLLPSVLLSNR